MKGTSNKTEIFIDERGFDPDLEKLVGNVRNEPWSDEDVEKLKRYYGKVPTQKLAVHLKRTNPAISAKVKALGLTFKKESESDDNELH